MGGLNQSLIRGYHKPIMDTVIDMMTYLSRLNGRMVYKDVLHKYGLTQGQIVSLRDHEGG